jgi:hypothetical protein
MRDVKRRVRSTTRAAFARCIARTARADGTLVSVQLDLDDVSRAFGRPVSSYAVEAIDPHLRIHSVTGGVYRVTADDESLVIKVVRHGEDDDPGGLWVSGDDPAHRNYWKREWLAFDSGLLGALPGDLRAPRTLLTTAPSDDECWIWMEDVRGRTGAAMELGDYEQIGRHLGTTQGAFAAGRVALPTYEWLSRNWLRGWIEANERNAAVIVDDAAWADPVLDAMRPLRRRALDVWEGRETLLAVVESAPQTVVHCDFWPMNLIVTDDASTYAIDWSQVGIGAVAQDVDQMTLDPVWMQVRPDTDPRQLERLVLNAYIDGLVDAGFEVNGQDVWQWYAAAAGVHYVPMLGFQATIAADPEKVRAAEQRHGRRFADFVASRARVIERAVELGERALRSAR